MKHEVIIKHCDWSLGHIIQREYRREKRRGDIKEKRINENDELKSKG